MRKGDDWVPVIQYNNLCREYSIHTIPKNHKRSNSSSSQSFMSEKGTHIIAPLPMLLSMWYPLSLPSWNSSHSLLWCATSNVLICHHGPGDGVPKVHTENTTVGCFGTDNGFLLMKKCYFCYITHYKYWRRIDIQLPSVSRFPSYTIIMYIYVYVNTVYIYIYKTIYAIPLLSQSSILRYLVSPQEILGTGQTCRIPAHFLWPDVQPSNKQLKAFPKDKELFIIYRSFVPRLLRRWQFFGSFIEKRFSARIKG